MFYLVLLSKVSGVCAFVSRLRNVEAWLAMFGNGAATPTTPISTCAMRRQAQRLWLHELEIQMECLINTDLCHLKSRHLPFLFSGYRIFCFCVQSEASLKDAWNAEEEDGALKSERGGSWVGPASLLAMAGMVLWAHEPILQHYLSLEKINNKGLQCVREQILMTHDLCFLDWRVLQTQLNQSRQILVVHACSCEIKDSCWLKPGKNLRGKPIFNHWAFGHQSCKTFGAKLRTTSSNQNWLAAKLPEGRPKVIFRDMASCLGWPAAAIAVVGTLRPKVAA